MLKTLIRIIVRALIIPALLIAVIFGAALVSGKNATASVADFRQQIDITTNNYRAANGLSRLTYDYSLEKVAQQWAEYLAANSEYYHNPNLSKQVFADNSFRAVAENLVAERDNGTIAVEAWIGSDGHRKNLLGNYNRQGIGVAYGGKHGITYVQVLGLKDNPAPTPQPQQPQPQQPTPKQPAPQPQPQAEQPQQPTPAPSQPQQPETPATPAETESSTPEATPQGEVEQTTQSAPAEKKEKAEKQEAKTTPTVKEAKPKTPAPAKTAEAKKAHLPFALTDAQHLDLVLGVLIVYFLGMLAALHAVTKAQRQL